MRNVSTWERKVEKGSGAVGELQKKGLVSIKTMRRLTSSEYILEGAGTMAP